MKVVGFTCLHYGKDYLAYAIRSIIDHIDEYHIAYTAIGSHGHRTQVRCPETRDELYSIASTAAGDKLRWHDGEWSYEGAQRESIHQYAPDADVIVVLDADEIWSDGLLPYILQSPGVLQTGMQRWRVPIIHYWRSFYRCVLHDPAYPIRVIFPKGVSGEGTIEPYPLREYRGDYHFKINHMGYAQRPEIVEYKILTHGHKGEWRKDVDWFKDRYLANAQNDCHPVGSEYWNPERVDPYDYMPHWMENHPYFHMGVIE